MATANRERGEAEPERAGEWKRLTKPEEEKVKTRRPGPKRADCETKVGESSAMTDGIVLGVEFVLSLVNWLRRTSQGV